MVQSEPQRLEMPDAEVLFYPGFFDSAESQLFFQELSTGIRWQQQSITLLG
jgi:hypothetical protein